MAGENGYGSRRRHLEVSTRHITRGEAVALAASHLDDARRHQMEAAKLLDAAGATRAGWHLAISTDAMDDARSLLTERGSE